MNFSRQSDCSFCVPPERSERLTFHHRGVLTNTTFGLRRSGASTSRARGRRFRNGCCSTKSPRPSTRPTTTETGAGTGSADRTQQRGEWAAHVHLILSANSRSNKTDGRNAQPVSRLSACVLRTHRYTGSASTKLTTQCPSRTWGSLPRGSFCPGELMNRQHPS